MMISYQPVNETIRMASRLGYIATFNITCRGMLQKVITDSMREVFDNVPSQYLHFAVVMICTVSNSYCNIEVATVYRLQYFPTGEMG